MFKRHESLGGLRQRRLPMARIMFAAALTSAVASGCSDTYTDTTRGAYTPETTYSEGEIELVRTLVNKELLDAIRELGLSPEQVPSLYESSLGANCSQENTQTDLYYCADHDRGVGSIVFDPEDILFLVDYFTVAANTNGKPIESSREETISAYVRFVLRHELGHVRQVRLFKPDLGVDNPTRELNADCVAGNGLAKTLSEPAVQSLFSIIYFMGDVSTHGTGKERQEALYNGIAWDDPEQCDRVYTTA